MNDLQKKAYILGLACLIGLMVVQLAWEAGNWMILKTIPLLLLWPGLYQRRIKVWQLSSLLLWFYFAEAVMRLWADQGASAVFAAAALVLTLLWFVAILLFVRQPRG
jgi:uncharacterized membrane protein